MITETRCQAGRAIQVRATGHMEAQGRAQAALTSHARHKTLLTLNTQRRALILAEALRREMYGAAARQPPPQTAAAQAQLSESAVPTAGAQPIFHLLRERTHSIYDTEERNAALILYFL